MSQSDIQIDRRSYARVRRTAAYRALAGSWDMPVLLACSGGADSIALLATAAIAADAGRVRPFVVVHVDHGTRPETAGEGRFVASVAAALGRPFAQVRLEDPGRAAQHGPEATLRTLRYEAIARLASRLGARSVVTAHTKDDQVETILMRLLSGSSPLASVGMRDIQILETSGGRLELQRPLLQVSRSELHQTLSILELPHREDPSNLDLDYRRNRVRHRVIPELVRMDPGFEDGLVRAVTLAAADAVVVDRMAQEAFDTNVCGDGEKQNVRRSFLQAADVAVSTRVVREAAMRLLTGDVRELTHERILAVVDAASGPTGKNIELPYGIIAIVERNQVVICRDRKR